MSCSQCRRSYAVVSGIPDFVGARHDFYEDKFTSERPNAVGGSSWASTPVGRLANWIWRNLSISARRQRFIVRAIPARDQLILDIACGGGTHALIGKGRVAGIDISLASALAAKRSYPAAACANALKLPVPTAAFDCVFSSDFFGHVPLEQKDTMLQEIHRCLKPGGKLVFTAETDSANPLTRSVKRHPDLYRQKFIEEIGGHHGLELPSALDARLCRIGFERISAAKIYSVLWPVRSYQRMLGGPYAQRGLGFRLLALASRCLSAHPLVRHTADCVLGVASDVIESVVPFDWGVGLCGVYRSQRNEETCRAAPRKKGAADMTVVVVTWNQPELLRSCLAHLERAVSDSGIGCEIWVVDNGSTAGDADVVADEFPSVRLIRSPANVGFARANNLALRRATGRCCLLVNNDVLVPSEALRSLAEFMDSRPEVGVAGASLVDANGNRQRSYGDILTPGRALADELHITTLLQGLRALSAPGADSDDAGPDWREVGYVSGAFFAVRREALDAVGLLDERFDFYSEEMDWCVRVRAEGWKVAVLKRVSVVHRHGATTRSQAELFHAVRLESRRRFLEKYHGPLASLAYRAAAGLGALLLMLRSAFPGGGRSRSQRFGVAVSALSWALRGRQPWPPSSD